MSSWWFRNASLALLIAVSLPVGACFSLDDLEKEEEHRTYVQDWRDEMIYQVLVDRFANGDTSNDWGVVPHSPARYHGGDWKGLEDKLDYIQSLGMTTIWISPIVKNVDQDATIDGYHGYWTQDFTGLNPHFGDMASLRSMVRAAHDRNMKVVLDIVTNHVGQVFFYDINGNGVPDEAVWGGGQSESPLEHRMEYDPDYEEPYVKSRTSLGEAGPAPIFFFQDGNSNHMAPECEGCPDPGLFLRREAYHLRGRVWNWGNDACCYYKLEGLPIPSYCTDNEVRDVVCNQVPNGDFPGGLKDLATENPKVRDAMQYVFRRWIKLVDFDGFRIDTIKHVDHGFWQDFAPRIRQYVKSLGKERFLMFGEAFTGFDPMIGSYTRPGELDSAFYFSQKYRVFDGVFKHGSPTSEVAALFKERQVNYGNEAQVDGAGLPPTQILVNFLDNHDVSRFMYEKPSKPALYSALTFLFTEDGIPCVYYGTEQDFSGGNDPANREDLWATNFATHGETFRFMQKLTGLRKSHEALRRGSLEIKLVDRAGAGILAFERISDNQRVLVVINTSDDQFKDTIGNKPDDADGAAVAPLLTGFAGGTALRDVLGMTPNGDTLVAPDGTLTINLGPREARILVP